MLSQRNMQESCDLSSATPLENYIPSIKAKVLSNSAPIKSKHKSIISSITSNALMNAIILLARLYSSMSFYSSCLSSSIYISKVAAQLFMMSFNIISYRIAKCVPILLLWVYISLFIICFVCSVVHTIMKTKRLDFKRYIKLYIILIGVQYLSMLCGVFYWVESVYLCGMHDGMIFAVYMVCSLLIEGCFTMIIMILLLIMSMAIIVEKIRAVAKLNRVAAEESCINSYIYNGAIEATCVICLELIKKNDVICFLACTCESIYHIQCLLEWHKHQSNCPLCRRDVQIL